MLHRCLYPGVNASQALLRNSSVSSGCTAATTCSLSAAGAVTAHSQQQPQPQLLQRALPQTQPTAQPPAQDQEALPHPGSLAASMQGVRARQLAPEGPHKQTRAGSGAGKAAAAAPERLCASQPWDLGPGSLQDPIVLSSDSDHDGPSPVRQFPGSNRGGPHELGTRPRSLWVKEPDQRHLQRRSRLPRSAGARRPPAALPTAPATGFSAAAPAVAAPEPGTSPGSQLPAAEVAAAGCASPGASLLQKRPREDVVSPSTSPKCPPGRATSTPRRKRNRSNLVQPLSSASEDSDQPGPMQALRQQGPGSRGGAAAGGPAAAAATAAVPAPGGAPAAPAAAGLATVKAPSAGAVSADIVALEDLGLSDAVAQALQRACQLNNVMVQFVRLPSPSDATGCKMQSKGAAPAPANIRPSQASVLPADSHPAVPADHDMAAALSPKPAPTAVVSAPVPPRAGASGAAVADAAATEAAAMEAAVSAVSAAETEVQTEVVSPAGDLADDATSPAVGDGSGQGLPQPRLASETSVRLPPPAASHPASDPRAPLAAAATAAAAAAAPRRSARQTRRKERQMTGGAPAREAGTEHADVGLDARQACKLRRDGMLMLNQDAAFLVDQSLAVVQQADDRDQGCSLAAGRRRGAVMPQQGDPLPPGAGDESFEYEMVACAVRCTCSNGTMDPYTFPTNYKRSHSSRMSSLCGTEVRSWAAAASVAAGNTLRLSLRGAGIAVELLRAGSVCAAGSPENVCGHPGHRGGGMGGGSHHPPGSRRISTGGADTAPGSQESEPDSEERRVQILEARLPRVQHIDLCERSKTAAQEEIEDLRKEPQRRDARARPYPESQLPTAAALAAAVPDGPFGRHGGPDAPLVKASPSGKVFVEAANTVLGRWVQRTTCAVPGIQSGRAVVYQERAEPHAPQTPSLTQGSLQAALEQGTQHFTLLRPCRGARAPMGAEVITLERIPCGSYVGRYGGDLVTASETEADERDHNGEPSYLWDLLEWDGTGEQAGCWVRGPTGEPVLGNYAAINARNSGNASRFLNHSCSPNVGSQMVLQQEGSAAVLFYALHDIQRGEALSISYGLDTAQFFREGCLCDVCPRAE